MALELVSGADFWCKLMSRGRPVGFERGAVLGVLFKDPGVLLKDPGVLFKDPGVQPRFYSRRRRCHSRRSVDRFHAAQCFRHGLAAETGPRRVLSRAIFTTSPGDPGVDKLTGGAAGPLWGR